MQAPHQKDGTFLNDIQAHRHTSRIWWLGQSGFLVHYQGSYLLLDPYLSDSLTRKYANTDKPHVRMTGRVVAPEALDFIDVAVSTHNHTDHLDAETLLPLRRANPDLQLIIPEANRTFVSNRLGCNPAWPIGLDDGTCATIGPFTFTGVPSAHETLITNADGCHHYLGYIVQFGPWTLYHPGDTMLYKGLEERLCRWTIDVALLPINGCRPERRVAGNLSGVEAARLARATRINTAIPCHYDMFSFNTADPARFIQEAGALGQGYCVLRNGEGYTLA